MPNVVFRSNKGIPRDRRNLRGRPKFDRADSHGSSTSYRRPARETEALQSPRDLPSNRAAFELADDRTDHVALVSAASRAGISESVSQTLLQRSCNSWRARDSG